jgi:hypothetical protein
MKTRLFIAGILMALSVFAHAQSFEGVVVYKNTYTSKLPQVKDEQFNAAMGTTQEYSMKGGNYKSALNGAMLQMQLYRQADNKLYTKMSMADTLYWTDGAVNNDEVVDFKILPKQEEVLGVMCDALVITSKSAKTTFYYNAKYKIDPTLYKGHVYANWYFMLEKSKALPLKMIMETAQFNMTSVATEIKPVKLDDKVFALPVGVPTRKSPY